MKGAEVARPAGAPYALWERQAAAVLAGELAKGFLSQRAILLYVLAFLPPALIGLVGMIAGRPAPLNSIPGRFSGAFFFELRVAIYFGSAWTFTNLFRSEILDRSLHYYFLMPMRREILVVAKYLAGLLGSMALFGTSTLLTLLALHARHPWPAVLSSVFSGQGLSTLLDYLGTTGFACLAYGALFLLGGLLFKNPFVPAVMFWGWEWLNYLLPPTLKKLTILHYLQSLAPLPFDQGTFALLAEPISPGLAMLALTTLSVVLVGLTAWRVRRMEIGYATE